MPDTCRCSHGFSCHVCDGCRDHHEPGCPVRVPDTAPPDDQDRITTTAAQRGDSRPRWRTNDLIQRLRELDPTGERTVFLEIGREPSVDTDPLAGVYVEDGNAVWDSARQRIVLTNEEPTP